MLTVFMFIYIVIRTYLHTVFEIYTSPKLTANAPEHFVWLSNTIKPPFLGICPFFRGELSAMLVSGRVMWFLPRGHDLRVARWRCRYEKTRDGIGVTWFATWFQSDTNPNAPPIFIISWLTEWILVKVMQFCVVKVFFFDTSVFFLCPDCHQVIL